jgi:hypothetical protein
MGIKKFNDFVNESEQSEEVKKALELLKNSGYDIKKIVGKKLKFESPKFDDLMKISEFRKIKEKFGLIERGKKEYLYHRNDLNSIATIIHSTEIGNKKGPACLRIGSTAKDHVTVAINRGCDPDNFSGTLIIRNVPFGTLQEKRSVFVTIEKYLYCAAIDLGGTSSISIVNNQPGDKLGSIVTAYNGIPSNQLAVEALHKVVGMMNEINPRRLALTLETIPDNKAMDLITAVLDNPKISTEMMKYLEAYPESFDDPAKIIRRYKSK